MPSWNELRTAKRCARAWKFSYVDKIKPRMRNVNLIRGGAFHEAMNAYLMSRDVDQAIIAAEYHLAPIEDRDVYLKTVVELTEALTYYLPRLGLGERYFVANEKDLFGVGDLPLIEYNFNYQNYYGYIDAILWDSVENEHVVVDWKLRASVISHKEAVIDGQLPLYVAVLNLLGANIHKAVMWQFRRKSPKPARLISNDSKLSPAAQDTTWDVWRDTAPKELLGEEEDAWKTKLSGKLKSPEQYMSKVDIAFNDTFLTHSLQDAESTQDMISIYRQMAEQHHQGMLPGTLSSYECRMCEFNALCTAVQSGGDVEQVRMDGYALKDWSGREDEYAEPF